MALFETIKPLYVLSGFAVGFLVGMTGVGGGSLMTPLLILLFKVHPVTAVGTDLIYASVTKTGGSAGPWSQQDHRLAHRAAPGHGQPAGFAFTMLVLALKIDPAAYSALVTKVLGVALSDRAGAAVPQPIAGRLFAADRCAHRTQTRLSPSLTGIVLGVLVTISSVGAGALGVTALMLLYPELPIVKIAGSDIAHAVPLTLVAGLGHLASGGIDMTVLMSLLCGSLPGIMLSSLFAPRLPDLALR